MAVNSVFLLCSAFVLFGVRRLFVFKRSEVGFCSVVLFGPLVLFGNSAGLFCAWLSKNHVSQLVFLVEKPRF